MSLTISLHQPPPTLLLLPPELRLQIYTHLLTLPPPLPSLPPSNIPASRLLCFEFLLRSLPYPTSPHPPLPEPRRPSCCSANKTPDNNDDNDGKLHINILSVCRKIYTEAAPVLYGYNAFFADEVLLTALPRLRPWFAPVTVGGVGGRVKRWHLRLRLDSPSPWPIEKVTQAFSGVEELVVHLWQATFLGGVGAETLRLFEDVRGVRRVEIRDAPPGFERYTAWLERRMGMPLGEEGEEYACEDVAERKRLDGWAAVGFSET
ncbi:hypothetical protein QBC34DRAFT_435789 [Podospora aff. communis PSN243]|uniref:DUF7730 domain-containing protein n=1 Tax=Podospora aff. communis PSN243 TaxID=3040156 RepID=A0AAV9GVU9_9PEZI|nr:hypothetical protein QBC34DRAFT_435789 [Podospora aff. communis PSN243]